MGWKIYAWGFALLFVVSLWGFDWHDGWAIARAVIDCIGIVGIIGFSYRQQIGPAIIWRVWLLVAISVELWSIFWGKTPSGFALVISIALVMPLYYGIFICAFRASRG